MRLRPGICLQGDKYRIIDTLGQGGFGITYLANQELADHKVCIKEFFPKEYYNRDADGLSISLGSQGSAAVMERFKDKFIKEAKTILRLKHHNIVNVHDVFKENNTCYYVMDYIDGESLRDLVNRRGVLAEGEAVGYIRQVAAALEYIHSRNVMHLDIKPGNIMLGKDDGNAVLIDFGLAKHYDEQSGDATSTTPVGVSHGYAPIEQYQQGGVGSFSPETDIYSLGATLYFLVVGQTPPSATAVGEHGLNLPDTLSLGVRSAIERAMSYWRKDRPHSIGEFMALLSTPRSDAQQTNQHGAPTDETTKVVKSEKLYVPSEDGWRPVMEKQRANSIWLKIADLFTTSFWRKLYVERNLRDANRGDAVAQGNLGYYYYYGKGVNRDYVEAVKWNRKAAEQGVAEAQYNLGVCYYNGRGVDQNYAEAVKWYRKAAEQGYAGAQNNLGVCYANGQGVGQDDAEAVKWYHRAAKQGHAMAQYNLGDRYYHGNGVDKNYAEAVKWCRKAAEQGHAEAQYNLGSCYDNGRGVDQNYAEAIKWYRKAAEQGQEEAQKRLKDLNEKW